jgi:hypothetical protein
MSMTRQILRTISGDRYTRVRRLRGPSRPTAGRFPAPPGSGGLVDYQDPKGKRQPRIYSGAAVVPESETPAPEGEATP